MSGTESDQEPIVSKEDNVKDQWIKAKTGVDAPRARRGAIMIGQQRKPLEKIVIGSHREATEEPASPEQLFNRKLNAELNAIDIIRTITPATTDAEVAEEKFETSLSEMTTAAKDKNFELATQKLGEAMAFGKTVSDERVKTKQAFDLKFPTLRDQLAQSVQRTEGVADVPQTVTAAEQDAATKQAEAEQAVEADNYKLATEKLVAFETALTELGKTYKTEADSADTRATKIIGRLTRRIEGLKGTDLTTEAQDAKKALDDVVKAQTDAQKLTPDEARLVGLLDAAAMAREADATAQKSLTKKFNTLAAKGLEEIRKSAGAAVAALATGDAKTGLLEKLSDWDKEKQLCDDETDGGKKKAALAKLDTDARKIMTDAAALDVTAKKDKAVSDAKSAVGGEVPALILATKSAIDALTDGDIKTGLLSDYTSGEAHYNSWALKIDSPKKDSVIQWHVNKWPGLLDSALKAAAEEKRQAGFKAALEKRFGLQIVVPPGMNNTNFDQFYDMLDRLPIQQSSQSSLKILRLDKDSKGASYNEGLGRVTMGNFDANTTWGYKNPVTGQPEDIRAYSINTLHEVGHAVDAKYRIMQSNGKNAGCGKWEPETVDKVVVAFLSDLKSTAGDKLTTADTPMKALIRGALTKGVVTDLSTKQKSVPDYDDGAKPGSMGDEEWALVKAQLNRAVKIRADNWPWGSGKEVKLGGRTYHEAYKNEWVSYDSSERAGTEVRDYQFRSPAEWFAELYAYTWFNKVKAPAGVNKAVMKYMYSAKA